MEVGEMESQAKEPWIPTTPAKPIVQKRVPICTPGEGNHLRCDANGAIACSEFSADVEKNCRPHHQSALAATAVNIAQDNAKTCVHTSSENVSSWVDCSFTKLVALADAASAHSNAAPPSSDGGLKNPFVATLKSPSMGDPVTNQTNTLLSHHQHSLEHGSIVHDKSQDPQGTSYIACCRKSTSQVAPPTPDAADREESKQVAAMQINIEERNQGGTEENIPAKMIDNNGTLQELSEPVTEFAAVSTKTPQQKPRRRKHRPKVIMEGKPKRTRKPVTPKPVQSKENPTGKRKYVRRKGLDKTSIPPTEATGESAKPMMPESAQKSCKRSLNFDIEARDETSASRENTTVHLDEVGVVVEKTDIGHACDLNTSLKHSLNNFMSLPEDTQAMTTPSKGNPPERKPKQSSTNKRKYIRRKVSNKTSTPPTEVTELTKPMVLKPARISCKRSLNFDIGAVDESSECRENSTLHLGKKIGVGTEETHEGRANELNTSMQQAFNIYMSLPEDTQAPSTPISKNNPPEAKPKQNPAGKRKYVKKKGLNKISTPPTEVAEELTRPMMPETAKMPWTRSLSFDAGARDESSAWKDNSMDQIVVVDEMHEGLAYNLNTAMKQDGHEKRTKIISKSVAQSNPNDFNSSKSPISMIGLQMVGSKRKRSGTLRRADTGSMNLIGAQYNELLAYNAKCWVQKKRRSAKGKNTSTTPSVTVTTTKDVRLATCTQEDARVHPYASRFFNCSISGSGYYAAGFPVMCEATESAIHDNHQTFKYISSLSQTRLTERSRAPSQICGCASMTGMTNCDTKPKHTMEQLGISDRQIFGGAERAQKCVDALVAEMHTSLTKKKRTKKESVLFSSAYFSTNKKQQHQNFALGIYHLPSDVAREAKWRHMLTVDALVEEFRTLNINREARDLRFNHQNALVPYQIQNSLVHGYGTIVPFQGPFSPIKKQHVRPKVDLDEETNRVWNLLMLDINSHGIDGTNEEKAKRWEEERNVFRGRTDSFIARMRLVQGDRRFSQWKGSVVDSVVGVFLTQNVSDHLSSSAFMSLAAQFPKKSSSKCKTYHGEGTSLVGSKPQVHIVEPEENKNWDEKILNQSVRDQSSMTIDIIENSEEKEAVGSNDSCRTTSTVISLTDEIHCRLLESAERNIREHQISVKRGPISTMTEEGQERSCYCSDRKELNDIVSSQCSVISSQTSGDFSIDQIPEKRGSCSDSNSEVEDMSSTAKYNIFYNNTSFSKLLEMASSTGLHEANSQRSKSTENLRDADGQSIGMKHGNPTENLEKSNVIRDSLEASIIPSHEDTLEQTPNSGVLEVHCFDPFNTEASSSGSLKDRDENCMNRTSFQTTESASQVAIPHSQSKLSQLDPQEQSNHMQQKIFSISGQTQDLMQKASELDFGDHKDTVRNETKEINSASRKLKSLQQRKDKKDDFNWDSLRIKAQAKAGKREKTENTIDSLDWDAVRCADVNEIANTIKERGMNNRLAERIKNFLNRLVEEHGSIDLEWLRDVPPDQAKEYLLSIRGLGLKSVECVRLLTLHHLAFPVDTNVGRIAVRLGWVPLQPLPESLQLHLLELYPVLESIQKYLWPRLCKLDQRTLYELHYQMITFGKVFCTKSKPNCNACPMRGECRHFASAFASARLALPGPEQRSIVSTDGNHKPEQGPSVIISQLTLPLPENTNQAEETQQTEVSRKMESKCEINICEPIIEEPATPEPECSQVSQNDIEDAFWEESCEIPTIKLNMEEFTLNLQNFMQENMELQEGEMSKALVALNPEAASIPMPKLKNVNRLRTEHCVYELPDSHSLLEGWDKREPDDPGKYLLAIWTPGETANSIQPPESKCSSQEFGQLCNEKECFSCNCFREANSQIVRGTILIPCRTAMRGSFPLNGTYFQVNEVFADHDSSLNPINVPRSWIWNLNRRTVYFGTSIPTIFKGLSTQEIQQCFWRGYVCVRGFDRETRAPRPLMARLHFPASKLAKTKEKTKKESTSAAS